MTVCEDCKRARADWLAAHGYERVREIFIMRADLSGLEEAGVAPAAHDDARDEALPSGDPAPPPGVALREIRFERDSRAAWQADNEAFAEHFGWFEVPFETWRAWLLSHETLRSDLWLLAWDGDRIAGQALALPRGDAAYVAAVSVDKAWRGRGLALCLLGELFRRLHRVGYDDVFLHVDAQNATGAVRLYEKAGMRVWRHLGCYRLALDEPGAGGAQPPSD